MTKRKPPKQCQICGELTASARNQVCPRLACVQENKRRGAERHARKERQQRYGQELKQSPVTCMVCGEQLVFLAPNHLKRHGLTMTEYRTQFPAAKMMTDGVRQQRSIGSLSRARHLTYEGREPDSQLYEFLIGCLLGDGTLECRRESTYRLQCKNDSTTSIYRGPITSTWNGVQVCRSYFAIYHRLQRHQRLTR